MLVSAVAIEEMVLVMEKVSWKSKFFFVPGHLGGLTSVSGDVFGHTDSILSF